MAAGNTRKEMIEKLETHGFPSYYIFKFIVPADSTSLVYALLPEGETQEKPSKTGKYVSISCKSYIDSAATAVDVYEKAQYIPGIIAL